MGLVGWDKGMALMGAQVWEQWDSGVSGPFPQFPIPGLQTRGPEPEELDAKSRELLTQQAAQCLSKLVQIAPRARRNFILDQVPGRAGPRGKREGSAGKPA